MNDRTNLAEVEPEFEGFDTVAEETTVAPVASTDAKTPRPKLLAPVGMEALLPGNAKLAQCLVNAGFFSRDQVNQYIVQTYGMKHKNVRNLLTKVLLHGASILHKTTNEPCPFAIKLAETAKLPFEVAFKKQFVAVKQKPVSDLLAPRGMEAMLLEYPELGRGLVKQGYLSRGTATNSVVGEDMKLHRAYNAMYEFIKLGRSLLNHFSGKPTLFAVKLAQSAKLTEKQAYGRQMLTARKHAPAARAPSKPRVRSPEEKKKIAEVFTAAAAEQGMVEATKPVTIEATEQIKDPAPPTLADSVDVDEKTEVPPYAGTGLILASTDFAKESLGPLIAAYNRKKIITDGDAGTALTGQKNIDLQKYQESIIPFFKGEYFITIPSKGEAIRYTGMAKAMAEIGGLTTDQAYGHLVRNLKNKSPQGATYKF